jgi:A/G-specific adenine glycosylase
LYATTPLRAELLAWFDVHKRDLPWRKTADPYAIWLSEVMLQQTQVVTVIPYWRRFLERFPTVAALAAAPLSDVLSAWRGLGYYSRARNLHRAAQSMVAQHGGQLPHDANSLRALPGFGPYTAGAVASIAFGRAAPAVDGNIARVFSRLFVVEGVPGGRERERRLWSLAQTWVEGERPGDWNQALMELGATLCKPEAPACLLCPVRRHCGALAQGRVEDLPPPRVRAPPRRLKLAVAVWERQGRFLLGRRDETGLFGGLWELPTAPLPKDERALGERFASAGLALELGTSLGVVRRVLTHRRLELHLFRAHGRRAPKRAEGYREFAWWSLAQTEALGVSTAMQKALELAASSKAQ